MGVSNYTTAIHCYAATSTHETRPPTDEASAIQRKHGVNMAEALRSVAKHYGLCGLLSLPQVDFAAAKAICSYEELHGGDAPWQSGIFASVLIHVSYGYLCSMDKSILKLVSESQCC